MTRTTVILFGGLLTRTVVYLSNAAQTYMYMCPSIATSSPERFSSL